MKVPLNWLREYVPLPEQIASLAERLTLAGLEVASVRAYGLPIPTGLRVKEEATGPVWQRDKIVVGKIRSVERHPNADRLTLPTVEYGAPEPKTVVTGAPNIKVGDSGQNVVLALSGSVLFDGHAIPKALKELKPSKIRGVASDAMVCSAYELGISEEHEGIILLQGDIKPGTPFADVMGDIVLELDVTPNLARCLSIIGVAREVAALMNASLRLPQVTVKAEGPQIEGRVTIDIENAALCARYTAILLENVKISSSPDWMQQRLTYAGMRPISNVVDITNYVMLEWGQPLHAFDYDVLLKRAGGQPPRILVRSAKPGEALLTLDGIKRSLTPENLIIADAVGPIALAGVMGGAETEVSATTTRILLESANFDFRSVRHTMKAFNLPSEASARFSRGMHPEIAPPATERAAELMQQYAGATIAKGMIDVYPAPLPEQKITLRLSEIRRLLGVDFPAEEATRILRTLEFQVTPEAADVLTVTTPPHRTDIQAGPADLIEDLARIRGYDQLPATLLADRLPVQQTNRPLLLEERTRDILALAGLQEVITYSLTDPARETPLGLVQGDYVRLANPINADRTVLRQTILAGVLDVTAANLRHRSEVRVFEIGPVYVPMPGEKLPREPRRLALALTGHRQSEFWIESANSERPTLDFFDLKGVVEALAGDLHLPKVSYARSTAAFLHPGKAALLLLDGKAVGNFGALHPKVAEAYNLGEREILAAELDLDAILASVPARHAYHPVPRFPAALRDVAVIVDENVSAEKLLSEIRAAGGELLADVRLFDVYRGTSIAPGKKSLAYALTYLADDRTLTDKEVDKAHKKIEDRLKHVLGASIRGQDGG